MTLFNSQAPLSFPFSFFLFFLFFSRKASTSKQTSRNQGKELSLVREGGGPSFSLSLSASRSWLVRCSNQCSRITQKQEPTSKRRGDPGPRREERERDWEASPRQYGDEGGGGWRSGRAGLLGHTRDSVRSFPRDPQQTTRAATMGYS